jgi:hypothetical protein
MQCLFGWLVADGWFVLRKGTGGWFVLREKYCWLVADKPNEQGVYCVAFDGIITYYPFAPSQLHSLMRSSRDHGKFR